MPIVRQREAARRDLVEHFVYLAENAGLDTADRFLSNAEATFGVTLPLQRRGLGLGERERLSTRQTCAQHWSGR